MSTHSALSVADYILNKSAESDNTLTPMQVIKLVYLCHGWMLGLYDRPLITDSVEAWQYGPVIRKLYNAVKKFRSSPVNEALMSKDRVEFDAHEVNIMDQVLQVYKSFSGPDLSRLTHATGTPWFITWNDIGHYTDISNDLIEDHFKRKIATAQ